MSANDHADSGYTNTYDNSQSQRSTGSSLSQNSNRSGSSGYCGGNPSNFGSSNEAVPQPISKKKEKEQKKKLKSLTVLENEHGESAQKCTGQQRDTGIYNHVSVKTEHVIKASEEVGTVELVDATQPCVHNAEPQSTLLERDLSQINLNNVSSNTNEEFYTLVSLHDGLILHSTHSFQTSLGYPKDAWLGNSFIDFIHLKDRPVFGDKVSGSYRVGDGEKDVGEKPISLFCRIKKYSGENMDDSSTEDREHSMRARQSEEKTHEALSFAPFHLNLGFKYFPEHDSGQEQPRMLFLIIMAQPVYSAYKGPEETIMSSIFSTRHTATCHMSHVDDDIVRYFGYLPQDMVGQSLFDYYHPEDLPFMKDVYETVVKRKGSSFRSKPYRFAVQNGGYVLLETEWSSFINPWEGKLEFVIGQHRVLRGPENPDVFQQHQPEQHDSLANLSEEVLKESQIIQHEICTLLTEQVIQKPLNPHSSLLTQKKTELISFIENFISESQGAKKGSRLETSIAVDDRSFSEHDSVMLGEISPHHEYCDSKSSSETPPSYNQLNYNDKIERFFDSKPLRNTMYGNDEEIINSRILSDNDMGKTTSSPTPTKSTANHDSGGSGSGENLSSASNNQPSFGSRDDSPHGNSNSAAVDSFKLPSLTEKLLNQHNHDMEEFMVLKHKERRSSIKNSKINKDNKMKAMEQPVEQDKPTGKARGTKRTSTHNREDELFKSSKYDDTTRKYERRNAPVSNQMNIDQMQGNINLWPQMTVIPPLPTNQHFITTSATSHQTPRCPTFSQMIPVYYVSMPRIRDYNTDTSTVQSSNQSQMPPHLRPNAYNTYATSAMAGVLYPPVLGAAPSATMIYAHPIILGVPTVSSENQQPIPIPSPVHRGKLENKSLKRPASQSTCVKAEPGSNTTMSDISKKPLSPGGLISSGLSMDGTDPRPVRPHNPVNPAQKSPAESSIEDSSDSSFYGSFLNTSSGSSCNPPPMALGNSSEKTSGKLYRTQNAPQTQSSLTQGSAPGMEGINVTPQLMYQYKLTPKPLEDVLKNDTKILNRFSQPLLMNDQLDQLYLDVELEGFGSKLRLEDNMNCTFGDGNRASGSQDHTDLSVQHKLTRSEMKHTTMAMMYEENPPLPPIST